MSPSILLALQFAGTPNMAVTPLDFEDVVRKEIAARLDGQAGVRVRKVLLYPSGRGQMFSGATNIEFTFRPGEEFMGWVPIEISRMRSGQVVDQLFAQAHVVRVQTVLVTQAPIARGAPLTRAAVTLADREWDRRSSPETQPLVSADGIEQMRTKRSLPAGEVITQADVEALPSARRGEKVTLICRGQNFVVTASGVLEQDARLGEPVPVRSEANERRVVGKLMDAKHVQVAP